MQFVSYHVGARDGTREFPVIEHFENSVFSVLFDGDADSVAELQKSRANDREKIYSFVISGQDGLMEFHNTLSPYTSSTLKEHQNDESWNLYWIDHDYLISQALEIVKTEKVYGRSIDSLLASDLRSVPPPDFLSLDTQGSELDILRGAVSTLNSSVVGCVAEVEFHPMYQDQPLFGDLSAFLSAQGFWFVGFETILDVAPYRYPVGLRGRGFHYTCNATFLKRPEVAAGLSRVQACKLAFCAITYGCFEVAWKCFDLINPAEVRDEFGSESRILTFLSELYEIYKRHPRMYPMTFKERNVAEAPAVRECPEDATEIESYLAGQGLASQAQTLKANRLKQQPFAR